jgi:hypothetical protein
MRISSSDKNAYALARALASMKHTEITCMVNRRGEHSLIPTRSVHPEDKRQVVKIITPKL